MAHAAVGAPLTALFRPALLVLVALLATVGLAVGPAAALGGSPGASGTTSPVTGNLTGPAYVPSGGNGTYYINATGGPAVVDGILTGKINWSAQVVGPTLTGVSIAPANGTIDTLGTPATTVLTAGNLTQTLSIEVLVTSTLGSVKSETNLTLTVTVRSPYIVRAIVTAGSTAVLPFHVLVLLDGARVGNVTVPTLVAFQSFQIVFRYANPGLSAGYHTFVFQLVNEHGLVAFSNGQDSFSTEFYVAASPPNYSVWYVAGAVAFFGALFIFATRVAARRRGTGKR